MSYASGTTHYNLPQTVGSDKRDWTDTNQAFSDIDAAIYGAAQGASAATSAIQTINGQIETITAAQAVDEGNISTLSGKVSTLESTVGTQGAAIADVRQDLQDNIESKREASATSTHLYNIGDTFYYNDVLYKATAQIAIGGTIVPSTNCTAITVMNEVNELTPLKWRKVGEVTGDGTVTFVNALASLNTAIGSFDPTRSYKLVDQTSTATYIYDANIIASDNASFVVASIASASVIRFYGYTIDGASSSYGYAAVTSTGTTFTDYSSESVNAGRKLTLYEAG